MFVNDAEKFVKIKPIQVGFSGFLKKLDFSQSFADGTCQMIL